MTDTAAADPAPLDPIPADSRIDALDVVRGFALLGIFLMNVEYFTRPLQDMAGAYIDPTMAGADRIADALIYFFVQNKFWTLFSLLFGMGFAVMIERAGAAGRAFYPVYLRRSLALLGIGAVHALLVWAGDILVMYSLGALVMLGINFLHREGDPAKPRTLAVAGTVAFALPMAAVLAIGMLGSLAKMAKIENPEVEKAKTELAVERADAVRVYSTGTYPQAVVRRGKDMSEQLAGPNLVFGLLGIVGVFVIGMAILRSGVLQRPGDHAVVLRRVRNWGLPLGFAVMGVSVAAGTGMRFDFDLRMSVQMIAYMAAGLILALAYGATIVLALEGRLGPVLRTWLAPAGRMALTNYLLQSVAGTLVFYGYGLGMWGQVGRAAQVGFVFAVFAAQMVLSRWWLSRFRFGPAEWVWRALTYGKAPAFRRALVA